MADDITTPWYLNRGTWINIVQAILGLLVAVGGVSTAGGLHIIDGGDISAGLGVTGLSAAHAYRQRRVATAVPTKKPLTQTDVAKRNQITS